MNELTNNSFLREMDDQLKVGNKTLHHFKKGSYIIKEGEPIDEIYYVVKGTYKVYKDYLNGKRLLIGFFPSPSSLGDIEYVTNTVATCSVEAVTDISYYKISYQEIDSLYQNDISFYKFLASHISNKYTITNFNVSLNLIYPLETRLASYLLSTSNVQKSALITLPNFTDLANSLGTSYRHLHRVIRQFDNDGLLKKDSHNITLLDKRKLEIIAEGNIYEMEN